MLTNLAFEAFDLNVVNYIKEKIKSYCVLMERAEVTIMVKHNMADYNIHQAMLDFMALRIDKVVFFWSKSSIQPLCC